MHGVVRMSRHSLTTWPELLGAAGDAGVFPAGGHAARLHRQDAQRPRACASNSRSTRATVTELPPCTNCSTARVMARIEPALALRFAQGMLPPAKASTTTGDSCWPRWRARWSAWACNCTGNTRRELAYFGADHPGWLLDCRGLGRGDWPQLRGVRGEVIRLHAPRSRSSGPRGCCTRATRPTSRPRKTMYS